MLNFSFSNTFSLIVELNIPEIRIQYYSKCLGKCFKHPHFFYSDLLTQTSAGTVHVPALAAVVKHIFTVLSWICIGVYSNLTTSVCTTQFSKQAQNENKTSFAKYCLK